MVEINPDLAARARPMNNVSTSLICFSIEFRSLTSALDLSWCTRSVSATGQPQG